jgi:hypothetical protein
MKKFLPLTKDEVVFKIDVEQDDIQVRDNALASGDDEQDKECEDAIIKRLNDGDVWAWASVHVIASWETNGFTGDSYLGCCSYENEEEFKSSGYYDDMCDEALKNLNDDLENHYELLMIRSVEE